MPSSGVFGDRDGDGDRENGIADIKQRNRLAKLREVEEKALAKRDQTGSGNHQRGHLIIPFGNIGLSALSVSLAFKIAWSEGRHSLLL